MENAPPSAVERALVRTLGSKDNSELANRVAAAVVPFIPVGSGAKDIYKSATGRNATTEEELSAIERGVAIFGVTTLGYGSALLDGTKVLARAVDDKRIQVATLGQNNEAAEQAKRDRAASHVLDRTIVPQPSREEWAAATAPPSAVTQLTSNIKAWLNDSRHREWLWDAGNIAFMPLVLENAASSASREILSAGVTADAANDVASLWRDHIPGVQVRRFGDWWVKRVNPDAGYLMQFWGQRSINAQYEGLQALKEIATPNYFRNNILFTRDVGPTLSDGLRLFNPISREAYLKGSMRIGFFNDIQPRNMGANGLIFDPSIDTVTKTLFLSGAAGDAGTVYGFYRSKK